MNSLTIGEFLVANLPARSRTDHAIGDETMVDLKLTHGVICCWPEVAICNQRPSVRPCVAER